MSVYPILWITSIDKQVFSLYVVCAHACTNHTYTCIHTRMHIIVECADRQIPLKYHCTLYKTLILPAIKQFSELKLDIYSFKTRNTSLTSSLKEIQMNLIL